MKHIIIFLFFFLITDFLIAEEINKKDLDILKEEDKALFLSKCFVKKEYLNSLRCINFLGIKTFLVAYKDETITKEIFEEITRKSVKYLKYSASKGNKESYLNLGWIFSVNKSSFYNLNKSAEFYKKAYLKETNIIKNNIKESKIKKNKTTNLSYSYTKLSIALIEKLEIYFSYSEGEKSYINSKELKEANIIYDKIISINNIKKKDLNKIKKKVKNDNKLILSFLKDDLKVYNKKYKDDANLVLEKLKRIYIKLN